MFLIPINPGGKDLQTFLITQIWEEKPQNVPHSHKFERKNPQNVPDSHRPMRKGAPKVPQSTFQSAQKTHTKPGGKSEVEREKRSSGVDSNHRISAQRGEKKKKIQPPAPKKEGVGTTQLMEISPSEKLILTIQRRRQKKEQLSAEHPAKRKSQAWSGKMIILT